MTHLRWVNSWLETGQGFPCLFHFFTGFYCPGCGGTRAVRLLLKGDLAGSFQYHPFVLYVCAALAVELVIWTACCFRRSVLGQKEVRYLPGMERRYRRWVAVGAFVVIVNWIVKNVFLLAGIDLLPPVG